MEEINSPQIHLCVNGEARITRRTFTYSFSTDYTASWYPEEIITISSSTGRIISSTTAKRQTKIPLIFLLLSLIFLYNPISFLQENGVCAEPEPCVMLRVKVAPVRCCCCCCCCAVRSWERGAFCCASRWSHKSLSPLLERCWVLPGRTTAKRRGGREGGREQRDMKQPGYTTRGELTYHH